jgi:hypothetical protein
MSEEHINPEHPEGEAPSESSPDEYADIGGGAEGIANPDQVQGMREQRDRLKTALPQAKADLVARSNDPQADLSYFVEFDPGSMSAEIMRNEISRMEQEIREIEKELGNYSTSRSIKNFLTGRS